MRDSGSTYVRPYVVKNGRGRYEKCAATLCMRYKAAGEYATRLEKKVDGCKKGGKADSVCMIDDV